MKKLTFQTLFTFLTLATFGQTKNVLFIGNSYTGVNNLPVLTKNLALSLQDTLNIDSNTPGGTTFNSHTNNATSLAKIAQGNWDYVILQAQSQEPSFPPSQVSAQTYPYAAILVDSILSANECTIPLFYMTWGRQNGDAGNCASYPVICTYDGMQSRLRESYLEMAIDNESEVSPVGAAWKYVRDNHPTINLYSADESHPSAAGSYLAACVHYASIYKKSPVGASYTFSLTSGDAAILQNVAHLIVMDSLENWNFGVREISGNFNTAPGTAANIDFTNTSLNATDYFWDFGDGMTSSLENPTHDYSFAGNYSATLIVSNSCGADTISQIISVTIDGLLNNNESAFKILQNQDFLILTSDKFETAEIRLISLEGKIIGSKMMNGSSIEIKTPMTSGIYFLTIFDKVSGKNLSHKVFIP